MCPPRRAPVEEEADDVLELLKRGADTGLIVPDPFLIFVKYCYEDVLSRGADSGRGLAQLSRIGFDRSSVLWIVLMSGLSFARFVSSWLTSFRHSTESLSGSGLGEPYRDDDGILFYVTFDNVLTKFNQIVTAKWRFERRN